MATTAFKVVPFTGELPALNGKSRIPSPFDEVVAKSFANGETMLVQVGAEEADRAAVIAQLHKAAKFVGCGLDLWRSLEEGVAFKAREKRNVTPAGAGASA